MKPKYHITPEYGFLNDPNGLTQFNGSYHVFYQWLPEVKAQGSKKWRHCISHDLVRWTDIGCALGPKEWFDKNGCYSGSGITDHEKCYLFYTGNVRDSQNNRQSYQCIAVSEDGETFKKEGPVIYLPDVYTPHFRDPKVWKYNNKWWIAVGAQTKDIKGNVALFSSDNLKNWDYIGNMLDENFDWGYMCECPDIIKINGQDFLIVSRQKENDCRAISFSGNMNYDIGKFTIDPSSKKLLDEGMDFYAPQSFQDNSGRYILFGWLGSGEIDYQMSQPCIEEGWLHSLTIPRELTIKNGILCQKPVEELKLLRKNEQYFEFSGNKCIDLNSTSAEILIENQYTQNISLCLGNTIKVNYSKEKRLLQVERKKWDYEGYDVKEKKINNLENIHIFIDQSTAEIFVNNGENVFTMKAYFYNNTEFNIYSEQNIKIKTWLMEV